MEKKLIYGLMVGFPIVGAIVAKALVPDGTPIKWVWYLGAGIAVLGIGGLLFGYKDLESKEEEKSDESK